MSEAAPQAGHNQPPPLSSYIPIETVKQCIEIEIAALKPRVEEWIGSCKRFVVKYPTIESVEADTIATELFAGIQRLTSKTGRIETARVALKAPILAADNAIGSLQKGPFSDLIQPLLDALKPIQAASIVYKQKLEADRRKVAQEEADCLAAQARAAEELASKGSPMVTFEDASKVAAAAEIAQRVANSSAADLTRSHGDQAGTSSLKYKRTFEIESPALVPRNLCMPSDAMIRSAIGVAETNHGDGWMKLPDGRWATRTLVAGCLVIDTPDLTVRR